MKTKKLFGIGDIHGMLGEMMLNLEDKGVVDSNGDWASEDGTLVLTGDLTDRGPHGYETIEKAYNLHKQAEAAGGDLVVTMGNHDIGFLNCAIFLVRRPKLRELISKINNGSREDTFKESNDGGTLYREKKHWRMGAVMNACANYAANPDTPEGIDESDLPDEAGELRVFKDQIADMLANGMNLEDLVKFMESPDLMMWAVGWPAMYLKDGVLFQHCDSHRVYKFFESIDDSDKTDPIQKANNALTLGLLSSSISPGYKFWGVTTSGRYWDSGEEIIPHHLEYFGGAKKVCHGHTRLFGEHLPMEYCDGRAVNLDVGLAYSPHHCGKKGRMVDLTEDAAKYKK
jgi:hypothetical protein